MGKDSSKDPCSSKAESKCPCGPTEPKEPPKKEADVSKCSGGQEPEKGASKFPKLDLKNPKDLLKNLPDIKSLLPKDLAKLLPKVDLKQMNAKTIGDGLNCAKNWIIQNCNPATIMADNKGVPSRPMKYPYTFAAKFAQFPLGHYVKNQWIWKYYVLSLAACVPVFYYINNLANSPANVAKWAEIRRKEAAEHH